MGDSPDPRDDAGSSDVEDAEESEPTEPAPESDASGGADESQDHESEDADELDAGNASAAADAEGASDAADAEDASEDTDGDAEDAPDEGDTDTGEGESDDLPDHLQPSDESAESNEERGDTAEPFDEEGDSFGTPPESSFESGEDWSEAMNSGDDPELGGDDELDGDDDEGEDGDITPDDALAVADPDGVVSEPADDFEEDAESGPTVDDTVQVGNLEGPATDEEMPLAVHIEEMVRRVAIVLGVAGVVTLIAYPLSERLIEFLWQSYVPQPDVNRPHVYGPLEFVLTKLKVAGLSGTIVGLPVFVYETYRFMKPGLYPHERRYYLASVPTSLVLAFVGVAFSHFVILPLTVLYFTSYTENAAIVAFGLRETFNLIVLMMGYMAVIFQIPLFVMLAIMMGLVTREWMEDKRLLFWGGFGGLAFTFVTVDPTGMAPIIIAVTMIVLFEGTLALLRWTGN